MASNSRTIRSCLVCAKELITCQTYYSLARKPNLTKILSETLREELSLNLPNYLCGICYRKAQKIQGCSSLREEFQNTYQATKMRNKENVRPLNTPTKKGSGRTKRMTCSSPSSPSLYHRKQKQQRCQPVNLSDKNVVRENEAPVFREVITIANGKEQARMKILPKWESVVQAIMDDDESMVFIEMEKLASFKSNCFVTVEKEISKECSFLCLPSTKSSFRQSSKEEFESFSFRKQLAEMENHTPVLLSILGTAATGPSIEKNKYKTRDSLVPGIVTAASVLFNCRSQLMNSHQLLTGFTILEGGCTKKAFARLGLWNLCSSYNYVIQKQTEFGVGFDTEVKKWIAQAESEKNQVVSTDSTTDKEAPANGMTSFQLAMDNVDMRIKTRHTTREHHGADYHMANVIAVKNRVDCSHLLDDTPTVNVENVDLGLFLPSQEDETALKNDWIVLMGHIIADHMPALKWIADELPKVIPHDHMTEAKKKSQVVSLGVVMENENTSEGIYNIMHYMHQYVPGHSTDTPTDIISAGDLLTCERESNCIEEQQNSSTPNKRLDGLIPAIADFHSYANFLQVVWQNLYDTSSGADKITLYSARNFLEARNVTNDPMKDVNAASDLLETYTKSLVIAAAMKYFGMDDPNDEPSQNTFRLDVHQDRLYYVRTVLTDLINKCVIPHVSEINYDVPQFKCVLCPKVYKTKNGLHRHTRTKHSLETVAPSQQATSQATEESPSDSLFNYARCSLGMCMVALNFVNARRLGDGKRLIRMYKYFLLHFKANGKQKYSFQVLRLLAKVHCFLSPRMAYDLMWNRFVNKTGQVYGNIEVDREVEHQNRVFKAQCKALHGKITAKSVERVSRFSQALDECLQRVDTEAGLRRQSGKHKKPDLGKDILALAIEMNRVKVFDYTPGRHMSSLRSFPSSTLGSLNIANLYSWIRTTLRGLSRKYVFRRNCKQE